MERAACRFRFCALAPARSVVEVVGTPYPNVVERVRAVVRAKPLVGRCNLVMDATGVGALVLDLLRRAQRGCGIDPVILTSGERESHADGVWCVPKQDLGSA